MEEQEIQAMKKELDDLKSILVLETPFLASLLRKCKIILNEDIETVGVDGKAMYINPKFFQPLSRKSKVFIYCHEVLHLAFNHVQRGLGKNHDLFNHASDCCINKILMSHGFKGKVEFPFEINLPENIAKDLSMEEEEIAKMSAEEIYYLLEKKYGQTPFNFNSMKDLLNSPNDKREAKKQIIVQQGDPAANDLRSPEEIEKYWQNAVNRAAIQAKMAGTLPAELERSISELSQSKLPWKKIIKKEIINGLGKTVISDWKKSSRRYALLPGNKRLISPNIWFLVDTSGSIDEKELKQFLGEVYGISKNQAQGIIVPWDAKVYPMIKLKKPSDIKLKTIKLYGGGGTLIQPALTETLALMKFGDMVVILTDGDIFDGNEPSTQDLFRKVGQKSTVAIFVTIIDKVHLTHKWKKIKIEA